MEGKALAEKLLVGEVFLFALCIVGFALGCLVHDVDKLILRIIAESCKQKIGNAAIRIQNEHDLARLACHLACQHVVLIGHVATVRGRLLERGDQHRNKGRVLTEFGLLQHRGIQRGQSADGKLSCLPRLIRKGCINAVGKIYIVSEDHIRIIRFGHGAYETDIRLRDLVFEDHGIGRILHFCNVFEHGVDKDLTVLLLDLVKIDRGHNIRDRLEVIRRFRNIDRVARKHIVLHGGNVALDTRGQRKHQGNTDNTD